MKSKLDKSSIVEQLILISFSGFISLKLNEHLEFIIRFPSCISKSKEIFLFSESILSENELLMIKNDLLLLLSLINLPAFRVLVSLFLYLFLKNKYHYLFHK